MRSTPTRLVTGCILVFILTACPGGSVDSVTITGGDRTLAQGTSLTLTVEVETTRAAVQTVAWTSSDAAVATVGPDGTVDALSPGSTTITATSTADPSKSDSITVTVEPPGAHAWTRQFGTAGSEGATGVATDASGNVYTAGYTGGDLEGANAGSSDAFVRSYDGSGSLRWTRQFGTPGYDSAEAVATDADGNVYAAGYTTGDLEGLNAGSIDAFVRSYDRDGTLRWTRQFGTSSDDFVYGVATDTDGNVYAVGSTMGDLEGTNAGGQDAFIRSYDGSGTLRWTRQFGTSTEDVAFAVATDGNGNAYAAGFTVGTLEGTSAGGVDAYVRSYDGSGALRWTRQFGTSSNDTTVAIAVAADATVYAAGETWGALEGPSAGGVDAFVRAYDETGALRWTRQFGTTGNDTAQGIAIGANGTVYVTGHTAGVLQDANAGNLDAFVRAFAPDGSLGWTRQFGTSSIDRAVAVATDPHGNVYAAGHTGGAIEGASAGGYDAFVRKYGP